MQYISVSLQILTVIIVGVDASAKISAELQSRMEKGEKPNILVFFSDETQPVVEKVKMQRIGERSVRNRAIYDGLKEHMSSSQSSVVNLLSARSAGSFQYFKQYWTSNKLFVKEASAEVIRAIAEDPKVVKIKEEPVAVIPPAPPGPKSSEDDLEQANEGDGISTTTRRPYWHSALWGHRRVQVKEAWEALGGNRGEGVVIGHIDSGVRHTHEALRDNFYGSAYGWYDPFEKRAEPVALTNHGTATLGILVGTQRDVGVAPGARWQSCLACDDICYGEHLLDCIKFFACPHLPDGSSPDCSKAPHIVSNSWTVPRGADDFNEDIQRWRDLGIIPVFAIGNGKPLCNSSLVPAELPFVIGVGATNDHSGMLEYSLFGWASDGSVKPDYVAPGDSVFTANIYHDTFYMATSGTSIATPFVAGVVALLKARDLNLSYDDAFTFLRDTTNRNLSLYDNPDYRCNASSTEVVPNIYWGYGEVNALRAVQAQTKQLETKNN